MSLQELIREFALQVRNDIRSHEVRLSQTDSELTAAKQRVQNDVRELAGKQAVVEDRKRRAVTLEEEVAHLLRLLSEKKILLEGAQEEVHEAEELTGNLRRDRKLASDEIERLEGAIEGLRQEREALDAGLLTAHMKAFCGYTKELQDAILQFASHQQIRQAKAERLQQLKHIRQSDPAVASLYDTRDELRRLLKAVSMPTIKESLTKQLEGIEQQLEKKFPGAQEAESLSATSSEELQELFYVHDADKRHSCIFLPFGRTTWDSLQSGSTDKSETTAVQIGWSVAQQLNAKWGEAQFELFPRVEIVVLKTAYDEELDNKQVTVPLAEGGTVSFMFSPLPEPVHKAMS